MLLRRQGREERDEHIDMTPMVDVVFQLMTFMLFSVQMTGGEKVEVPHARHGVGVEESTATFLTLLKPEAPGAGFQAPASATARGATANHGTSPQGRGRRDRRKAAARSSSRPMAASPTARSSKWPPPSAR